jgi:hypothetical protein
MRLETLKYPHDIQRAAAALAGFTAAKTFADYASEAMLRAAVERQFEIIGEALAQPAKRDAALARVSATTGASSPFVISSFTAMPTWTIGSSGTSSRRSCFSCVARSICS